MPFNKAACKAGIKAAFQSEVPDPTADQLAAFDRIAEKITDAVAVQVKACIDTAAITNTAVPVLASPSGPVTGTVTVTSTIQGQVT